MKKRNKSLNEIECGINATLRHLERIMEDIETTNSLEAATTESFNVAKLYLQYEQTFPEEIKKSLYMKIMIMDLAYRRMQDFLRTAIIRSLDHH